MRPPITLAVVLAGAGCLGPPPLTQKDIVITRLPVSAPIASRPPMTRTETTILQPASGDLIQVSCAAQTRAVAAAPPGMVASQVQTTTTYKQQWSLGLDYLQVRLPFPHLFIFTGPQRATPGPLSATSP